LIRLDKSEPSRRLHPHPLLIDRFGLDQRLNGLGFVLVTGLKHQTHAAEKDDVSVPPSRTSRRWIGQQDQERWWRGQENRERQAFQTQVVLDQGAKVVQASLGQGGPPGCREDLVSKPLLLCGVDNMVPEVLVYRPMETAVF